MTYREFLRELTDFGAARFMDLSLDDKAKTISLFMVDPKHAYDMPDHTDRALRAFVVGLASAHLEVPHLTAASRLAQDFVETVGDEIKGQVDKDLAEEYDRQRSHNGPWSDESEVTYGHKHRYANA